MRTERSSDLLERDQSRESFNVRIGHTAHSASSQAKLARENEREALLFSSSPTTTPLHWRSINPLRFIFYHPRLTDFEEKIEGLWTGSEKFFLHTTCLKNSFSARSVKERVSASRKVLTQFHLVEKSTYFTQKMHLPKPNVKDFHVKSKSQ